MMAEQKLTYDERKMLEWMNSQGTARYPYDGLLIDRLVKRGLAYCDGASSMTPHESWFKITPAGRAALAQTPDDDTPAEVYRVVNVGTDEDRYELQHYNPRAPGLHYYHHVGIVPQERADEIESAFNAAADRGFEALRNCYAVYAGVIVNEEASPPAATPAPVTTAELVSALQWIYDLVDTELGRESRFASIDGDNRIFVDIAMKANGLLARIPVYVITDAGRKVLAQPVETPVPVLISDDQASRMMDLEGYLNRRGQRALAAWRQSKTGI
jgi:hypothetical protein